MKEENLGRVQQENRQSAIMKAIQKRWMGAASNPLYEYCDQHKKETCVIPEQGCMQCTIKDKRSGIIDFTFPFRYLETWKDNKYHVNEEKTSGNKELIRFMGFWSRKQSVEEQKALIRIWEV